MLKRVLRAAHRDIILVEDDVVREAGVVGPRDRLASLDGDGGRVERLGTEAAPHASADAWLHSPMLSMRRMLLLAST